MKKIIFLVVLSLILPLTFVSYNFLKYKEFHSIKVIDLRGYTDKKIIDTIKEIQEKSHPKRTQASPEETIVIKNGGYCFLLGNK